MLSRHIIGPDSEGPARVDAGTMKVQKPASEFILKTHVEPKKDMERERARAQFQVSELEAFLAGGEDQVDLRKRCAEALKNDPNFSKLDRYFLSREELYKTTLRQQLALPAKVAQMGEANPLVAGKMLREMLDEPGGLDLHVGMFIPTIQGQGDAEQQRYWLPLCYKTRIIGTYAQTELGHGTFLRGLETTATFDKESQEFIIHSPTLSSTKWWPGGLGKTSNHAVVMARLFTEGEDRGPHAFIVQLRSAEDHSPMPGITIGDIGNKMGYNAVDNGFLRMDHVRIPRRNMLMRHAQVDEQGVYHPPEVAKASYGTMVFVRADIVTNAALYLKKGVTIAIRYNAVRRQSNPTGPTGLELQVLDYEHSQRSLLPLLARAYAFHFTGEHMRRLYMEFEQASRKNGDFSALPELHATASGLKAWCTWGSKEGLEACRMACGGHGYMHLSGIPHTAANFAPQATYEGDNNVLCLQTARYLLKAAKAASEGEALTGQATYLMSFKPGAKCGIARRQKSFPGGPYPGAAKKSSSESCVSLPPLLSAYAHRAARMVRTAAARPLSQLNADPFQEHMCEWINAAKAHCSYVVLCHFMKGVEEADKLCTPSTSRVLRSLLALHALAGIQDHLGEFMEDGYLTVDQAAIVHEEVALLLRELRPNAVGLVDAFGLDDYFLNSALGAYDGDVYSRLYHWVQAAPMNAKIQGPGYEELLQPKLSKFQKSKL